MNLQSKNATRIAELNDALRAALVYRVPAPHGQIMMTRGVASLDDRTRGDLLNSVARFSDFNENNDPYGEHDFAKITIGEQTFFFKIAYYDRASWKSGKEYGAEDPSNMNTSWRVMTIMKASEY